MKRYVFLAVWATVLLGCQKGSVTPDVPLGVVAPLEISVGTESMTRTPNIGKWFSHGTQINVILLDKGSTTSYNSMLSYQLDRPDERVEGTWVPAGLSDPLEVKQEEAIVLAHYPAAEQVTLSSDKQSITPTSPHSLDLGENNVSTLYESFQMSLNPAAPTVFTEIFSAKADLDYMTGSGGDVSTKEGKTKSTNIAMKHAKAMVVVNLFKEEEYLGDDRLKSLTIANTPTGAKPLKEGSFKLSDNSFTPTNEITYHRSMSQFNGGTHFSLLVFPATIASENDVTMEFFVGVIRYKLKVPAKQWESGRVYVYNVQLSANEVVLQGGVMVYDWPATTKLTIDLE